MRRMLMGLALAGAIAGLGAAGPGCTGLTSPPVAGSVRTDEVALGLAVAAGAAANNSFALAIEAGVLTDKVRAASIKTLLDQYDVLLVAARAAESLGDSATMAAKLEAARSLANQINSLIPRKV